MKIWLNHFIVAILAIIAIVALSVHNVSDQTGSSFDKQKASVNLHKIDHLSNETYLFKAKKTADSLPVIQTLERFDLIFVGYDLRSEHKKAYTLDLARSIPGDYTHLLAYLGKDENGFAYAVEMNMNQNQSLSMGIEGLEVNGQIFLYCLGSDFDQKPCPNDHYPYGIKTYDFMWAKRLQPVLKEQLMRYETQLMATIKQDLINAHPFQLQFHVGLDTTVNKHITIIDDGRDNGSDCATYFMSLFEEVASVCLDNTRMSAKNWESYYLDTPLGQQAVIPEKYNPFFEGDIHIQKELTHSGYEAIDNVPRQTTCSDKRKVSGLTTPNLIFNSQSLVDVNEVKTPTNLGNF